LPVFSVNAALALEKIIRKMRKFTWLLLILLSGNAFSQALKVDFKYGVMLSNLSSTQRTTTTALSPTNVPIAIDSVATVDWLQLVPAFTWQRKNGDFGQVSIPRWQLQGQQTVRTDGNNVQTTGIDRRFNLGVQYTYEKRFLKNKSAQWLPMLGLGVMPYVQYSHFKPMIETRFPTSNTTVGLRGTLNPHVMWLPTSRLFVDMGLSIGFFDLSLNKAYDGSPAHIDRRTSSINWNMLDGSNGVKVGVGVKI
jgi:hypothetical protein